MLFPNKLFSYEESVISKFPVILTAIKDTPMKIRPLFKENEKSFSGVSEFYEVLDCLYALQKICLNSKGELILC